MLRFHCLSSTDQRHSLHLLNDPQGFCEALFEKHLQNKKSKLPLETKLDILQLVTRLVGLHKLVRSLYSTSLATLVADNCADDITFILLFHLTPYSATTVCDIVHGVISGMYPRLLASLGTEQHSLLLNPTTVLLIIRISKRHMTMSHPRR